MKKLFSVIRTIAFVVLILFICFIIFTMSQGRNVSVAGYQVLRVLTSSMEPTIVGNTCIIIKEVPTEELKVGDIITFVSEDPNIYGYYNTHRIHEIVEEDGVTAYKTKGDNSSEVDPYLVLPEQVVGVFLRELPGGQLIGKMFVALSDNKMYFIFIMLPLALCLISYFWQIVGMITGRYEEEEEDGEDSIEEQDETPIKEIEEVDVTDETESIEIVVEENHEN